MRTVARCGVPVMCTWSVRVGVCRRCVVGAGAPTRQPEGMSHGSATSARPGAQPVVRGRGDQHLVGSGGGFEPVEAAVEQAGVEVAGDHVGVGEQVARELDVGGHAEHVGVGERPVQAAQRARPGPGRAR